MSVAPHLSIVKLPYHPSLVKADAFLAVFNEKFEKKFGGELTASKHRTPYWDMVVSGMQKAQACRSCPFLACIVACEVAKRANGPMLPPQAYNMMMQQVCGQTGIGYKGTESKVDDSLVPKILEETIRNLPDDCSPLAIPGDVHRRLEHCLKELGENNDRICDAVYGKGKELGYWKKDLRDFAEDILKKLYPIPKEDQPNSWMNVE